MYTKQLLEDINNIINENPISDRMNVVSDVNDYRELGKSGSYDRTQKSPETLKSEAIKVYNIVKQKIEKLIKDKKYNLIISSFKRLAEELELQEENIPPNKSRVSKDFRIDDQKRKEKYKFFLASFNKLNSNEKAELISLLTSKDSENIKKIADELATQ